MKKSDDGWIVSVPVLLLQAVSGAALGALMWQVLLLLTPRFVTRVHWVLTVVAVPVIVATCLGIVLMVWKPKTLVVFVAGLGLGVLFMAAIGSFLVGDL